MSRLCLQEILFHEEDQKLKNLFEKIKSPAIRRDLKNIPKCHRIYDNFHCWPLVSANTTVEIPCPGLHTGERTYRDKNLIAKKKCNSKGEWEVTDFDKCMKYYLMYDKDDPIIEKYSQQLKRINLINSNNYNTNNPEPIPETSIFNTHNKHIHSAEHNHQLAPPAYEIIVSITNVALIFTSLLSIISCIIGIYMFKKLTKSTVSHVSQSEKIRYSIHMNLFFSFVIYHGNTLFKVQFFGS